MLEQLLALALSGRMRETGWLRTSCFPVRAEFVNSGQPARPAAEEARPTPPAPAERSQGPWPSASARRRWNERRDGLDL